MSDASEKAVDGAYALGIEMLDRGETPAAVEQKLVAMGVSVDAARNIISSYSRATVQASGSDGKTDMQFGAVVLTLAIVDLLYSGVGSVVPWLVMAIAGYKFYRGWSKSRMARS